MMTTLAQARVLREATLDDVPQLVALGVRFLAETAYGTRIATNPAQIQAHMASLIAGAGDASVILTHETGSVLDGMIGFVVFVHPMSAERIASECFWWANPQSGAGMRLFRAAMRWAEQYDPDAIHMIAPEPRVAQIYARLGFVEVETIWQRRRKEVAA